jgi:hypothetical protein
VQTALQLLGVSGALLAQLGAFEATLRNTLIDVGARFQALQRLLEAK